MRREQQKQKSGLNYKSEDFTIIEVTPLQVTFTAWFVPNCVAQSGRQGRLLLGLSDNDLFLLAAHTLRDGKAAMQAAGSCSLGGVGAVLKILRESDAAGELSRLFVCK